MVIHLGMNPINGGKPLNDRSIKGIRTLIKGLIEFNLFIWFLFSKDDLLIVKKIGIMIKEYMQKYTNEYNGFNDDVNLIIHPMCVRDEYAMMDRRFVWLIPIIPPRMAFIAAISRIRCFEFILRMKIISIRGASFCQVDSSKHEFHEIDDITDGYQKCIGATPSFSRIEKINKVLIEFR